MVYQLRKYVRLCASAGLVLGRLPKINLFGLHYCVNCSVVEAKLVVFVSRPSLNRTLRTKLYHSTSLGGHQYWARDKYQLSVKGLRSP